MYLLVLGLPLHLSAVWGSGIGLPSLGLCVSWRRGCIWGHMRRRHMRTKELPGRGHLPWWQPSSGSAHSPGLRACLCRMGSRLYFPGCKPVGKATSGCSCTAEAAVHVAQDRLCDGVCGRLAVCCSATSRAALRFSLSLWLTYLMRSKQEWWMSLTGGSFESQEELASYSSLSWSLMMFQMAAVPSAHVPEWGWWQLRAEPPQGWEDMW